VTRILVASIFGALLALAGAAAAEPDPKQEKKSAEEEKAIGLDRRVAEKLLAANEHLAEERYDAALTIVDDLAKRRKLGPAELAQIHRFRGYIFVNKGMMEPAAAEFQKSLAQNALDRSAKQAMTYSLAQILTQLGRYDEALAQIDAWFASEETPKPDAYYLKAMILVQQEKFEAAEEPARIAVERSPQPRESWLQLLVAIYGHLKDYPNVAATLERLASINPGKKLYWIQLAAVQNHLERSEDALATLRVAHRAELLDEDKDLRQLARLLYLQELPFQCAEVLEGGLAAGKLDPDADAYGLLSNCYLAAREADEALAPLAKAAELSPDGEMYTLLGQLHLQREEFDLALEALQHALAKAKPERRGSVQLLIGVAQLGSERFDDAERAFRAAQADEKVRRAAESYLKFVQEQRERREQQEALRTASLS
jgi:tetratricopeptide (TPR) repeat protein